MPTRYGLSTGTLLPAGEAAYTEVWYPHPPPEGKLRLPYVIKWNDGKYYCVPLDFAQSSAVLWDYSNAPPAPSWLGPFKTLRDAAVTLHLTITE
jgi:hypothetical protein